MVTKTAISSQAIETNRERFVRIIERRVNRILDNLDSLGKCSNRKNYEYSEEDTKKIFDEIERRVKEVKALFKSGSKNRNSFKLHD
jgi:hypothetical protein